MGLDGTVCAQAEGQYGGAPVPGEAWKQVNDMRLHSTSESFLIYGEIWSQLHNGTCAMVSCCHANVSRSNMSLCGMTVSVQLIQYGIQKKYCWNASAGCPWVTPQAENHC